MHLIKDNYNFLSNPIICKLMIFYYQRVGNVKLLGLVKFVTKMVAGARVSKNGFLLKMINVVLCP